LCKGRCRTNVRRRDCEVDFIWFYKIPQSFFFVPKKRQLPLQGSLCGQGQALSLPRRRLLRIARNSLWLSLTHYATPLFRKNHARLACSVVNALTTAHCRYQLLRFAYGTSSFASYRSQQPLAVSHSLRNSSSSAKITLCLPVRL